MKFLHTGDLHLGKTLYEYSLQEEQMHMLHILEKELLHDDYAALIISGDVYDRSIPPVEAINLCSTFLSSIRKNLPHISILIIPGNHDSAIRLGYASEIFSFQNIYIVSKPEDTLKPIIINHNDESLAFYLLPFLASGSIIPQEEEGELSFSVPLKGQQEMVKEAINRIVDGKKKDIASVLVAHLFTLSALTSESERSFLGTAAQVDPSLFRPFSYTALGHLHKTQRISDRVWYAGSPLAYSFDEVETQKNFLKVNIDTKTTGFPVIVEKVPINPLRTIRRISDSFSSFYKNSEYIHYKNDFLEIEFTDDEIVENPMALLRPRFPYLLNIKQKALNIESLLETEKMINQLTEKTSGKISLADDCSAFLSSLYGIAETEKIELFTKLAQEVEDETT